jgi:hypothetical protein
MLQAQTRRAYIQMIQDHSINLSLTSGLPSISHFLTDRFLGSKESTPVAINEHYVFTVGDQEITVRVRLTIHDSISCRHRTIILTSSSGATLLNQKDNTQTRMYLKLRVASKETETFAISTLCHQVHHERPVWAV